MRVRPVCVVAAVMLAGCGRREERQTTVAPPRTQGDSLIHAIAPELEEWVAMWRAAMPKFKADSLWALPRYRWTPVAESGFEDPDSLGRNLYGVWSPDGTRCLVIDSHLWFRINGDAIEAGGAKESRPRLVDHRTQTGVSVALCESSCGYHWASWLSGTRFVLAGWQDSESGGKQGTLFVYDLGDSMVTPYTTRVVSAADYPRYFVAWKRWLHGFIRDYKTPPGIGNM
jgi:hypothetical protein